MRENNFKVETMVINAFMKQLVKKTAFKLDQTTFNLVQTKITFLHPLQQSENSGFLMISRGIEREHWPETG